MPASPAAVPPMRNDTQMAPDSIARVLGLALQGQAPMMANSPVAPTLPDPMSMGAEGGLGRLLGWSQLPMPQPQQAQRPDMNAVPRVAGLGPSGFVSDGGLATADVAAGNFMEWLMGSPVPSTPVYGKPPVIPNLADRTAAPAAPAQAPVANVSASQRTSSSQTDPLTIASILKDLGEPNVTTPTTQTEAQGAPADKRSLFARMLDGGSMAPLWGTIGGSLSRGEGFGSAIEQGFNKQKAIDSEPAAIAKAQADLSKVNAETDKLRQEALKAQQDAVKTSEEAKYVGADAETRRINAEANAKSADASMKSAAAAIAKVATEVTGIMDDKSVAKSLTDISMAIGENPLIQNEIRDQGLTAQEWTYEQHNTAVKAPENKRYLDMTPAKAEEVVREIQAITSLSGEEEGSKETMAALQQKLVAYSNIYGVEAVNKIITQK